MKKLVVPVVVCVLSVVGTATWMHAQQQKSTIPTLDFVELQRLLWNNHMGYDFAMRDHGDLWLSTFTSDAILESGSQPPITGSENIRQFALTPLKNDPDRKFRHWTSTFSAVPNAKGAILTAFFIAVLNNGKNGGMLMGRTGYYESQVVKTPQGWKLKHHVVRQEGDISAFPDSPRLLTPPATKPQER